MNKRIETDSVSVIPHAGVWVSVFSAIDGQARKSGIMRVHGDGVCIERPNGPSLRLKPKGKDVWENERGSTFVLFS